MLGLLHQPQWINLKACTFAECWWLMHEILATQEAEIRKIVVQSQPRQIVLKTLS
jgi:hypothetical protein